MSSELHESLSSIDPPPTNKGMSQAMGEGGATPMDGSMKDSDGLASPTGSRSWEKPWQPEEIRKSANNWSLAGDAGLLLFLQEFSQRMISQTHEIEKKVDGLVSDAKSTGVSLNNVFNDFIMLANTQFVENRVYDEDVTQDNSVENDKKEEKEKSREERESELIPRVSEALSLGFAVIDNAFEKLDMNAGNSDSEDEEEPVYRGEIILEPKDPYLNRPLPYVIGTQAFMQDDDIGLVDVTSEEDEESDHGSLSESESESEPEPQVKPVSQRRMTDSETDSEYTTSESEEDEEDLFGKAPEDKRIEDIEEYIAQAEAKENAPVKTAEPTDFASQLSAKLNATSQPQTEKSSNDIEQVKEKESRKRSSSKVKKEKETANEDALFGGEPEEEDNSPFSRKGGLFSGGGGLFDDDGDDGGGLFDDIVAPKTKPLDEPVPKEIVEEKTPDPEPVQPKTKSGKKVPTGGVSIFGDGDDDLFSDPMLTDKQKTPIVENVMKKPAVTSSGGLFDDDDDDLFASVAPAKKASSQPVVKSAVTSSSLFDDDDDDLFAVPAPSTGIVKKEEPVIPPTVEKKETPSQNDVSKKKPVGGVSVFGNAGNPLAAAIKAQRKQVSDEESDGWSDEDKPSSVTSTNQAPPSNDSTMKPTVPNNEAPPNPVLTASPSSNSLFAEEPEDDLFTPKVVDKVTDKPQSRQASVDQDDEGGLFSAAPKSAKNITSKGRSSSLFVENDDGDDIFSAATENKKKPVGGVALFGGGDLFAEAKNKVEKRDESSRKENEAVRSRASTKVSLFDDEDTNNDDLFSPTSSTAKSRPSTLQPTTATGKPRSKSKSLFDDEDVLFGTAESDPSVDLFGVQSPLSPPAKPFPTTVERQSSVDQVGTPPAGGVTVAGTTTCASSTDGVKKASPPKVPLRKAEILKLGGATSTESSSDLFGGSVDEGDLFTSKPSPTKTPSGGVTKPKKFAGAVSMFGGLDPSSLVKKDQTDSANDNDQSQPDGFSDPPKPRSASRSSYDGPMPFGTSASASTTRGFKSVTPPKPTANKLQTSMSVDSALSSATSADLEVTSISFDRPPAAVDTLHSVSKDRAKITTRRRPPTRKVRQASARHSAIDIMTDSSQTDETDNSPLTNHNAASMGGPANQSLFNNNIGNATAKQNARLPSGISNAQANTSSNKQDQDDLFATKSSNNKDLGDIFSSQTPSKGPKIDEVSQNGSERSKTVTANPKQSSVVTDQMNDIYANIKQKDNFLPAGKEPNKTRSNPDDDIFADSFTNKKPNDALFSKSTESKKKDPLEDDIFADSFASKKQKESKVKTLPEDDIFADASIKVNNTISKSKSEDVFSPRKDLKTTTISSNPVPEDEDIFASAPKEKRKPKKAVSKDEDIFTDNTDIFADLPPSKSKDKKPSKKATTSASVEKPLFKDMVDDIFSDVKPKAKKNTPKKKADAAPSIFDDNIFDDPLSAAKP